MNSIKTRIFLALILVVGIIAGITMSAARNALEQEITDAEARAVHNVLKLVEDNIRGRYHTLLQNKVETIQTRKQESREFAQLIQSTLDHFVELVDQGAVSESAAQAMAQRWLAEILPGHSNFLLVLDAQQRVLLSPIPSQIGGTLQELHDIKGRKVASAAWEESDRFGETFLSFHWMGADGNTQAKFAHFVQHRRWKWLIGIVGDVGRVEAQVARQLDQLRSELISNLPYILTNGRGVVFIFDGRGAMVVPPKDQPYSQVSVETIDELRKLAQVNTGLAIGLSLPNSMALEGRAVYIKPFDWYIASLVSVEAMQRPIHHLMTRLGGILLAALSIGLVLAYLFAHYLTRPLNRLTDYAIGLPNTDFAADQSNDGHALLPLERKDEIGRLARAFVFMENKLHENVRGLMQAISQRQRIESELNVAHDIQMDLLPKMFSAFPERAEIDLFATVVPAKEIGGDLYNFYFLDEHHLCFTIGDVSGKGVPAALFMAITMALIRVASERESDPAQMLRRVNADLSRDNPNCIFVTLVIGVLDVRTGHILFANAGHSPPLVLRQGGQMEILRGISGPAAGVVDDVEFTLMQTQLHTGDCLLLYTDGVNEAMDADYQLYGNERLHQLFSQCHQRTAAQIVQDIMVDVRTHATGAEQSDDITIVAVRFQGAARSSEKEAEASL